MKFSQDFIEKVRDSNDLMGIISEYTHLKPMGDRHFALCPFPNHNEKTPSFSVSQSKQLYYCFGCKKSGNIFTFLQEMKGLNFPEAVEYLADRAQIPLPIESVPSMQQASQKEKRQELLAINQAALSYFQNHLNSLSPSHPARSYCQKRGLQQDALNYFKLGYVSEEWEGFVHFLKKQNLSLSLAHELGLIKPKKQGEGYFDIFRGRLMFPIFSQRGEVIGFGGRILGDGQPKYLNSPESLIFNKRKIFYGLNFSARYIRENDEVIVVEGYMDWIALFTAGIKNVVATLGTALTMDHAKLLSRFTKNVVVLYDGDAAGQEASERSLPILLSEGLFPKGAQLSEGMDPDDFVRAKGVEALSKFIGSSQDLLSLVLEKHFSGFMGQPGEKVQLMDQISPLLSMVKDERLLQLYLNELAVRMGESLQWVLQGYQFWQRQQRQQPQVHGQSFTSHNNAGGNQPQKAQKLAQMPQNGVLSREGGGHKSHVEAHKNTSDPHQGEEAEPKIKIIKPPKVELYLLNLSLKHKQYLEALDKEEMDKQFLSQGIRLAFQKALKLYRQMPNNFDKLSVLLTSQVEPQDAVTLFMSEPELAGTLESSRKLFEDCVRKVKRDFLRREKKALAEGLRGKTVQEQSLELERIMNIEKNIRALNQEIE